MSPFFPRRLPFHLTVPETSLLYNLEVSATRFPNRAALSFGSASVSYREFRAQAEALAGYLQKECGIRRGDRVARGQVVEEARLLGQVADAPPDLGTLAYDVQSKDLSGAVCRAYEAQQQLQSGGLSRSVRSADGRNHSAPALERDFRQPAPYSDVADAQGHTSSRRILSSRWKKNGAPMRLKATPSRNSPPVSGRIRHRQSEMSTSSPPARALGTIREDGR